jgi:hypothetical protein
MLLVPGMAMASLTITSGPNYGTWSIGEIQVQLTATGGSGGYSWSVVSGSLPPGLALRTDVPPFFSAGATAGLIGVATAPPSSPTTYNFTLKVTSNGQATTMASSMTISSLTAMDLYTLPDAFVNAAYTYTLTPLNNVGAVTWTLNNGTLPPGVQLSSTGVLTGPATTSGSYNWNVEITDGVSTVFRGFQLNVYDVQITSPSTLKNATQNTPYSATVTATGPAGCCTFSSPPNNSLPNGLSIDPNSGVISGTVTAGPGPWNFAITATAGAVSYTKQMEIDTVAAPPMLPGIEIYGANNNWDDCSIGVNCSRQVFAANGGIAPFTWTASGLPPGMSIRWGSGTSSYVGGAAAEIWGTPTETQNGPYNVQLTVTDFTGATATNTFPLNVSVLTVDGNDYLPSGTIGVPYSKTLRVVGGSAPYTVSQIGGELPDGVSLNPATFLVSGTPLENGPFFNTAFEFGDNAKNSIQATSYYSISDGASTITINQYYNLGTALLDTFYDYQLAACCASAYTWSFAGGQMPSGLTISPSGVLSGTLTATGTYKFLIKVADASNAANTGFEQFVMTVTPIVLSYSNIQPNGSLPYGNVGTLYSQTLTASGGTGALTWTLFPFNYLPPGLSLASNGTISGTPTEPGFFAFTAIVSDMAGNTANLYLSIPIYPAGVTEPLNLPFGPNLGTYTIGGLTFELIAVGGTPPYTYSLTPGATVIPGMRVVNQTVPTYFQPNATGGYIGVITAAGTYSSSLRVTDAKNKVFDQPITITISPLNILTADGDLPHATLGTPYTFTFPPYGGSGNYNWSASNFPPGMGINASTGQLTGTPTLAGNFYPQITLEDITNSTSLGQGFYLVVDPFAITTDAVLMDGTVNVAYNEALSAPGCGSGCNWTLLYSSLPEGLSLSTNGVISGSPDYSTTQFFFTVQASGSNGTVEKLFSIQINGSTPEPLFITESSPIVCCFAGVGAGQGFELFAEGGTPPYSWSLTSGALPTGVTIQGPGETISSDFLPGVTYLTGKSVQAGTYNFTLQVQDSVGATYSTPFTWSISPIWVDYSSLPLPNTSLTYDVPYTQQMLAMGGTGNYTWANLTPMPPGLSITAAGVISGTPTNTGYFYPQIQVADTDDPRDATSPYIYFTVAGPTSTEVYFGAGPNLGVWQAGYTATINLNPYGGTAPYTITALSALPPGFALESGDSSPYGGYYLVGQPLSQGTFTFTLKAVDSLGNTGVSTFTLTVAPFTLYTTTQLADGSVGTAYSQQLLSFDSTSTVSWSIAPGSALPPGLGVSPAGVISGTPTAANYYSFQLNGTAAGLTVPFFFNLRISNIVITNALTLQEGTVGVPYSYTLTATGNVASLVWSAQYEQLPGLTMSPTGTISGTPSYTGAFPITITATDGTIPVSISTTLYINDPNPTELDYTLQNTGLPDATVGASYVYNLIPDGGIPPYSWIVAPGSTLPPGLSLISGAQLSPNIAPGATQLAGAPTTVGMYTFNLIATDITGAQTRRTFTLKVSPLSIVSAYGGGLPSATENTSYAEQFTAVGGKPPYTFSTSATYLDNDILPPGMSLSSTGLLSGTPTSTGNYSFYLTVQDSLGNSYKTFQNLLVTNATGLYVTTGENPWDHTLGFGDNWYLGTNESSTYTWTVLGGTFPSGSGLSIQSLGPNQTYLVAQPTIAGTYVFTLRATDNANASNFADHTFTFRASPVDVVIPREQSLGFTPLPTGQIGAPYSFTYEVAGGTPPYTFTESPFSPIPAGLKLSTTGVLSGTPAQTGRYEVQPIITDAAGYILASYPITLVITPSGTAPPLVSYSPIGLFDASVGVPLRENVWELDREVQTGTPPYTWTVAAGSSLPPGLAILPGSNGVSSYLGGTATTPGFYNPSLLVTDASGQSLTISFEFSVSPLALSPGVLPNGTVGVPYSVTLSPSGGTAPYTIEAVPFWDLPVGMTLSSTGVLSGTPSSPGYFTIEFEVTDHAGLVTDIAYNITIDNAAGQSPAISLSPDPILITYVQGTPNPAPIPITVGATSGTLAYEISVAGVPGASLSATGGTAPGTVNLSLNMSGVALGTYTGLVAADASQSVNRGDATPVILTVTSPPVCSYTLNPASGTAPIGGASGTFEVNTSPGCPWSTSVPVADPWITVTSGGSGVGSGTVSYSTQPNPAGERTGTINVAGQAYTITQFGTGCSFALNPATLNVSAAGGMATIYVIASGSTCTWSASSSSGLIIPPNTGGKGFGTVPVTIPANPNGSQQTLMATIAGQTLTVNEMGTSCTVTLGSSSASFTAAGGSSSFAVNTGPGCSYTTTPGPSWITITSGGSGSGPGTLAYSVSPNSTTASRTGSFSVEGQLFTVAQQGLACSLTVDTSGLGTPYASTGGAGIIAITTNGPSCTWTASSGSKFVTLSNTSGTGSGSVGVTASSNSLPTSRAATLTIGGQTVNVTQGGTVCSYSLQSSSGSVPASGAMGEVGVIAPSNCSWTSSTTTPWLTITSSGNAGTSEVQYVAQPNTSPTPRVGSLAIAGLTYTVDQAGAGCSYTFNPPSTNVAATGIKSATEAFSITGSSCMVQDAVSYAGWVTNVSTVVSGTSGTVTYTVAQNLSGSSRTGIIELGTQLFTITQNAATCQAPPFGGFGINSFGTAYDEDGTGGVQSGMLLGSWAEQGCPTPKASTNTPSAITLAPVTGPVSGIYTLDYGVGAYNSVTLIPRIMDIVFGGQIFTVKQYPWQ